MSQLSYSIIVNLMHGRLYTWRHQLANEQTTHRMAYNATQVSDLYNKCRIYTTSVGSIQQRDDALNYALYHPATELSLRRMSAVGWARMPCLSRKIVPWMISCDSTRN